MEDRVLFLENQSRSKHTSNVDGYGASLLFVGIQSSEKRAFDAVMEWGTAEGSGRGLADMELLLPLIRYPLMSSEELQVGIPPHHFAIPVTLKGIILSPHVSTYP
jgi:hypothetical protein